MAEVILLIILVMDNGHIDRWRSAEAGAYQSPGNADSAFGSLWSWTIGHAAAYRDGGHADL